MADGDIGHVMQHHRHALVLRQHYIVDIAGRTDQADTAHDRGLLADIDGLAAEFDVAVVQRLENFGGMVTPYCSSLC